ncbi:hypothetical protein [Ramlibacter sp. PS4R-6]|uniref:hypothetical protein n=1 Tax=Ramlibacter sp. PS4R-6 TaxID=3133438 RepID=UPI00309EA828
MQREVTAIVLCILAQAAAAQCVATPASTEAQATPIVNVSARTAQAPQNAARPGGELIKAAAAGTRDDAPPAARDSVSARGAQQPGDDHPHRGGAAMLLAALALMSGIALRRYGSRDA